ncbi:hypothetical protein D3P08_01165 [Paenibacillus nanensis]|uniref:Bactofilin n=1 Tax=Paenibacillus nanensis TaxID=393251 RepID=A0A3A1VH20_9BACL|nr:hypothetical protein [Paenibacillus nanensis]RIX60218.1 hypothetical protein D3P08_01165 [Paenibacillus nanensis]
MVEALPNVRLVGDSETIGGRFGRLRITGDAKFAGDVTCDLFALTGTAQVSGGLAMKSMSFTGDVKVEGPLHGGNLKGTGELLLKSGFRGEELRLLGSLTASEAVEAERISLRGALQSPGLVNADELTIRMHGPSRAKEIAGGSLTIRRSRGMALKDLIRSSHRSELMAELIEGDDLYIEYVRADVVRGNKISLGPGCVIGRVEYRHTIQKHAKAKTGTEVRV